MTQAAPERNPNPLVSLVVPCFNEQAAVPAFLAAADRFLAGLRLELVFINDGSRDGTLAVLLAAARQDPRIRVVDLSRNFGKEAALSAGLDHARGDVIVPIDVDLQDPPEVIHDFIARWREGYDVVYGLRSDRRSDKVAKRVTASLFYRLFNLVSDRRIPENAGDFRLIDRRVGEAMKALPERGRFMKGLFEWIGFRSVAVPYVRAERSAGQPKQNFVRLWRLALDGIFNFSALPLRVWSYVGAVISLGALVFAVVIMVKTALLGVDVPGYASLATIVLFLGGLQLFTLGIFGEYLSRVFAEVKGRPVYVVDRIYEADAAEAGESARRAPPSPLVLVRNQPVE